MKEKINEYALQLPKSLLVTFLPEDALQIIGWLVAGYIIVLLVWSNARQLDSFVEWAWNCRVKWVGRKKSARQEGGKQVVGVSEEASRPARTAVLSETLVQASFLKILLARSDQPRESSESLHGSESDPGAG